jgi:hypothetical protein
MKMQAAAAIALACVVVLGFALYVVGSLLTAIKQSTSDYIQTLRAKRAQRLAAAKQSQLQRISAAQEAEIQRYRSENPVRIVGSPNIEAFNRVFDLLDDFARTANAFRPQLIDNCDLRFRSCQFPKVHLSRTGPTLML